MDPWLSETRDALARASGVEGLELSADDEATLLDLARIAAHESGERMNAPLLCYLVGRARREHVSLDELAAAVRSTS